MKITALETIRSAEFPNILWVQVVTGELTVNGLDVAAGDAVALSEESILEINALTQCQFLVFDLN